MKLTNTLTRTKEVLEPAQSGKVKLYTCGPTVYDYAHIGNLRCFLFYDTLKRALLSQGLKVNQVMNITDVGHLVSDADEGEDKLEKGAAREGKTVWQVADFFIEAFMQDSRKLNILPPTKLVRATDTIEAQINLVQALIDKGYAYVAERAVYFDVTRLADYGKLSGQSLADKQVGARSEVVTDSQKKHPQDFALWFFTVGHFKDHQMQWPSPWGNGFPGWHLECSAIVHSNLGEPIDIHTGGVDHIGTHHTNEIAQTEAAYGSQLSRYWLHNEHLLANGKKMSKSLGNFYTLSDLEQKGFSPLAFRLLTLQANYRSQQNFTWESLTAAQQYLLDLYAWADRRYQLTPGNGNPDLSLRLEGTQKLFDESLADDLGTPQALGSLSDLVRWMQKGPIASRDQEGFEQFIEHVDSVLGLGLVDRPDISEPETKLITQREAARVSQDFKAADRLRNELASLELEVEDTPYGPRWRRTSIKIGMHK